MRTCLASAAIAALIVFGLESVGLGQQSQNPSGSSSGSATNAARTTTSTAGGQTGQSSSMFGQLGAVSRLPDLRSGEFVGVSVEDVRGALTATGAQRGTGGGGSGQMGRSDFSPFGSSGFNRQLQALGLGYGSGRTTTEIRARIRLGFSVPPPGSVQLAQLGSKLALRLEKSSWLQTRSPVQVSVENDTAILRGTVATDHDRRLAERMARLEPGIRQVDNQLTVAPPAESPLASPTAQQP